MPTHTHSHRRRHQSVQVRLLTTTQARVLKLSVLGFVGLIFLIVMGAKLFPPERTGRYMSADQERACFNAHMSGDTHLASLICDPDQWSADATVRKAR